MRRPSRHHVIAVIVVTALLALSGARADARQLGALLSPGPLARAHQKLEGGSQCQQCHEAGRRVTPEKCLSCHQPIAKRIGSRKGVHRAVTECVSCHAEHAGVDGDLLHLQRATFDHARDAGLALDGLHAKVATTCVSCHKSRSYLQARTECSTCHVDTHKGALGADCTRCHSTQSRFDEASTVFDHSTARFPLTGAHLQTACAQCHKDARFRDSSASATAVAACASCHDDPHQAKLGSTCTSCHNTGGWKTQRVDHARTAFPLVGAHTQVACAKCHQAQGRPGAMTRTATFMTAPLKFDRCAACHANVHRDSLSDDCQSCHTEKTFTGAAFDHLQRTKFPLDGKHRNLECASCHTRVSASSVPLSSKVVDYRGADAACIACHRNDDPHKGRYGRSCEACHLTSTFDAKNFTHPRAPEFYGGEHQRLACEQCHVPDMTTGPGRPTKASLACVSCHEDVHAGQLGADCERCHTVTGRKFEALAFSHERSRFDLTGKHRTTECAGCHRRETRTFPSGPATATVYHPLEASCRSCHEDQHLGQLDLACERCHDTAAFTVASFRHRDMDDFFGGFHGRYGCEACHRLEAGRYPGGEGKTIRYLVGRTCADCHKGY